MRNLRNGQGRGGGVRCFSATHAPRLLLKFGGFFSVSYRPLHKAHWLVHVALNPVNHSTLTGDEPKMEGGREENGKKETAGAVMLLCEGMCVFHTFRALLWYLTAFLVSTFAASTWSTAFDTFASMLSMMSPWNTNTHDQREPHTHTLNNMYYSTLLTHNSLIVALLTFRLFPLHKIAEPMAPQSSDSVLKVSVVCFLVAAEGTIRN